MDKVKRSWTGKNKAYVRDQKVKYLQSLGIKNPLCLSFPGADLKLENLLIGKGLVTPNRIVGIQTTRKIGQADGLDVLDQILARLMLRQWDMPIFVGDFYRFPAAHNSINKYKPTTTPKRPQNNYKLWRQKYVGANSKFSFVDLDMCSAFNARDAAATSDLFRLGLLAREGKFVINHQKGRELERSIKRYLDKSAPGISGEVDFRCGGTRWRYFHIPLFYVLQANKYGYHLVLDNAIEYKDKNENGRPATGMIQYFFSFAHKQKVPNSPLLKMGRLGRIGRLRDHAVQAENSKTFTSDVLQKRSA